MTGEPEKGYNALVAIGAARDAADALFTQLVNAKERKASDQEILSITNEWIDANLRYQNLNIKYRNNMAPSYRKPPKRR